MASVVGVTGKTSSVEREQDGEARTRRKFGEAITSVGLRGEFLRELSSASFPEGRRRRGQY